MLRNGKPLRVFRQADFPGLLGFSKKSSIAGKGCFVSCVAMATQLSSTILDPKQVNESAKAGRGFVAGTDSLILERAAKASGLCAPEELRLRDLDVADEFDIELARQTIDCSLLPYDQGAPGVGGFFVGGGFCIANVDHTGDGNPDHFILIVGRHPDGGWSALDPAPGASIRIGPDFKGVSRWSADVEKHYVVWGLAPIGVIIGG